ncbi:MAG: VCBS repeat-containing protein [Candidatus Hydrogenedentes bacterium]|nr:VCBS repeat-containing protein [Candidatus Hydrogenedentota bacterium]
MITAVLILSLLAAPWAGDALPALRVGPPRPIGGVPVPNWRNEDIDADGKRDLVFLDHAVLQREGRFPEARIALPDQPGAIALDTWEGSLYLRSLHRLEVYRWNGAAWEPTFTQDFTWPDFDAAYELGAGLRRQGALRFETFLADLDKDNYPEMVVADRNAVHCFRRTENAFLKVGEWALYPPLQLTMTSSRALWPPQARRVMLPVRQMACTVLLEAGQIAVLHRETQGEGDCFVRNSFALTRDVNSGNFALTPGTPERSELVPEHVKPARLNSDSILDFAGGRWELSMTTPLPTPIFETWASVDGGKSFTVKRATSLQSFRPHCSFIDFDNDGFSDLVTEGVAWSGGPRETLNRMLMATQIAHVIRVYRQREGGFNEEPDYTAQVEVDLAYPIVRGGPRLLQYQAGELVNITGDFNGDGLRDLCVRTVETTVEITPTVREDGVLRPAWESRETVPGLNAQDTLRVADVDQDGQSDLIFQTASPGAETPDAVTRVLFNMQKDR